MPEPIKHAEHRGALESLLRRIPGFRGYLEKEYRRDSDALQRTWLAERLQRGKRALDTVAARLADGGRLNLTTQCDQLRARIDRLIARIRGAWQGYSGVFDLVHVDEGLLDKVYQLDVALMNQVEEFADAIEQLAGLPAKPAPASDPSPSATGATDPALALPRLGALLDAIEPKCDQRADLLKGLG